MKLLITIILVFFSVSCTTSYSLVSNDEYQQGATEIVVTPVYIDSYYWGFGTYEYYRLYRYCDYYYVFYAYSPYFQYRSINYWNNPYRYNYYSRNWGYPYSYNNHYYMNNYYGPRGSGRNSYGSTSDRGSRSTDDGTRPIKPVVKPNTVTTKQSPKKVNTPAVRSPRTTQTPNQSTYRHTTKSSTTRSYSPPNTQKTYQQRSTPARSYTPQRTAPQRSTQQRTSPQRSTQQSSPRSTGQGRR